MRKLLVILLALFAFTWSAISIYKIVTTIAPDFSILWLIAKDFYRTPNPYLNPNIFTPSGYPPFTYLIYLPLTIFPYKIAQTIFILLSFASVFGSVHLSLKLVFKKTDLYTFLFALSLTLVSFPAKFTLGMGQVNAIVLFLLLYSYSLYTKNKPALSGTLVGISIILKPIFVFFLLFYIFKKEWRVVFYSLLVILSGFLGSLIYYGPSLWFYWLKDIVTPLMNFAGREVYYNQGFLGFISRLITNIPIRKVSEWASLLFLVPVIYFSVKKRDNLLTLSGFIISLLLIDSLSLQHHFIWLIFPLIVISSCAVKFKKLWFWIFLGVSYFLASWNFKNPSLFFGFPKSLILSNTFYGTIILYFLTLLCLIKIKMPQGNLTKKP